MFFGGADGARTRDLQIDSLAFYPTELRPRPKNIILWWAEQGLNP